MKKIFAFDKLLKSVLLTLAFNLISVAVLSLIVFFGDIPEKAVSAAVITLSALCTFFGSLVLARNIESRGLLHGLILGMCYVILLLILSMAAYGTLSWSIKNIMRCACIVAAAMLGGVIGINAKSETVSA